MLHSSYYSRISAAKIIGRSLRVYGDKFHVLFFPFLIIGLIESVLWNFAFDLIPQFKVQPGFTENFLVQLITYLTFAIPILAAFCVINWMIDAFPNGLIVKYSSDMLEGSSPNLSASLKTATLKIFSLLSVGLITGLLVILGFVLLIIPGIIVAVVFSLAIPAIIIEDSKVFESLRRSRKLVAEGSWQVFSVLLFTFLFIAMAGVIGEILCSYIIGIKGYSRLLIISIFISTAKPLQPVALTHLYYSLTASRKILEVRKPYQPIIPTPPSVGRRVQEWIGSVSYTHLTLPTN